MGRIRHNVMDYHNLIGNSLDLTWDNDGEWIMMI
jgi:hypothetical protein